MTKAREEVWWESRFYFPRYESWTVLLTGCMDLGKLCNFYELQVPHLEVKGNNNSPTLLGNSVDLMR